MGEKYDTPSGVATSTPASAAATEGKPRTVDRKGNPVDPPPPFKPKSDPVTMRDILGTDDKGGKRDLNTKVWFEDEGTWAESSDGRRGFFTGSSTGVWIDEQGSLMPTDWKGRI